jgi:hypothetical protein
MARHFQHRQWGNFVETKPYRNLSQFRMKQMFLDEYDRELKGKNKLPLSTMVVGSIVLVVQFYIICLSVIGVFKLLASNF